jgi:hypothetical protein
VTAVSPVTRLPHPLCMPCLRERLAEGYTWTEVRARRRAWAREHLAEADCAARCAVCARFLCAVCADRVILDRVRRFPGVRSCCWACQETLRAWRRQAGSVLA